jgi:hypothetical protein
LFAPASLQQQSNNPDVIKNVKVARRGLHLGSITVPMCGDIAHSAVVVTTANNDVYLLEFMNSNKVRTTKLGNHNMKLIKSEPTYVNAEITTLAKDNWTIQAKGCKSSNNVTRQEAVRLMGDDHYNFSIKGAFGLDDDYNVCHSRQELLCDKLCDN